MHRRILAALIVLALPAIAAAQTHPCDAPVSSALTVTQNPGGTYTLGWCHDPRDTNDPTKVVPPSGWVVYVDGQRGVLSNVTKSATANAAGSFYYTAPTGVPVVGSHTYMIAALYPTTVYAAGESAKSGPFVLTVNPAPVPFVPKSPGNLRVVVG